MSVAVDVQKCTGCRGLKEPRCVESCPGDLMALDAVIGKAYIRDPRDCWDCMSCVKLCPHGALETRLPFQLANFGASLRPKVARDRIVWTLTDAAGNTEEFVIKTLEA